MSRLFVAWLLIAAPSGAAEDIVVADFEGDGWRGWKTEGDAFGKGPTKDPRHGERWLSGVLGKGFASSWADGNEWVGTLTSPAFKIERRYLNFLVAGRGLPVAARVQLIVGGKLVRTGPSPAPPQADKLEWCTWDVSHFAGKLAVVKLIDEDRYHGSHLDVDHLVQSDTPRQPGLASRTLTVTRRYLHLPVRHSSGAVLRLSVDGLVLREAAAELTDKEPDFWAAIDVSAHQGKAVVIEAVVRPGSKALDAVTQSNDELTDAADLYREPGRPRLHYSARRGLTGAPTGLVHHQGEWHLFYQYNPFGLDSGTHWGHAVSKYLVRWQELPPALHPPRYGDWPLGGAVAVDVVNTSGLKRRSEPALVAAFKSAARGQCLAYSTDRGRTWVEEKDNPVVPLDLLRPRLLWHKPTRRWVMLTTNEYGRSVLHTSPDLKEWERGERGEKIFAVADLFEMPDPDRKGSSRWVLMGDDGEYVLCNFDGKELRPAEPTRRLWYGRAQAAQTGRDDSGRRFQIALARDIDSGSRLFRGRMTFPSELTLRPGPSGPRLHALPVEEIKGLHGKSWTWTNSVLKPEQDILVGIKGERFDIQAEFTTDGADVFGLMVHGRGVVYDVEKQMLSFRNEKIALPPEDGRIRLRVLVDRDMVELFANDGAVAGCFALDRLPRAPSLELFQRGTLIRSLRVTELRSAWDR